MQNYSKRLFVPNVDFCHTFLYVCLLGLMENAIFSTANRDMSIYHVNILSVCLSVMLQKALLLMDVVILVICINTTFQMLYKMIKCLLKTNVGNVSIAKIHGF